MPQAIRQLSAFAVHSRKHWLSIAQKAKRRVYYREEFNSKIRNRFFLQDCCKQEPFLMSEIPFSIAFYIRRVYRRYMRFT